MKYRHNHMNHLKPAIHSIDQMKYILLFEHVDFWPDIIYWHPQLRNSKAVCWINRIFCQNRGRRGAWLHLCVATGGDDDTFSFYTVLVLPQFLVFTGAELTCHIFSIRAGMLVSKSKHTHAWNRGAWFDLCVANFSNKWRLQKQSPVTRTLLCF